MREAEKNGCILHKPIQKRPEAFVEGSSFSSPHAEAVSAFGTPCTV
jgi:hypothetical protein